MRTGEIAGTGGNIELSKIILGSCYFGTDITTENAHRLLDKYYALGGRTIDTAHVYANWLPSGEQASEKTIGSWIKNRDCRSDVKIITKGGHPLLENMHNARLSHECLEKDLNESLRALQTDYVDVYFLHRDKPEIPVSEIMDTLYGFVSEGKVLAIGASNWSLSRILEANEYAYKTGKTPFSVSQTQWSLALCTPESWGDDTIVCMNKSDYEGYKKAGIPVMAFSPQAKGFFSKLIENGPESLNNKIVNRFMTDTNIKRTERVKKICNKTGVNPASVVIAYITCNRLNGFAVVGCSNIAQLEDTLKGADFYLDYDILDWLENG